MEKNVSLPTVIILITFLFCLTVSSNFAQTNSQNDKELAQTMDLVEQGRFIDALPLLKKISERYPKNAELMAHYGIAVLTNLVTLKDADARAGERRKAAEILAKAKELGTKNQVALHYLDNLANDDSELDSVSGSASKEVEGLIREGEAFFGRADYDNAFILYEKAYKLDPKNYEAALFAGDCLYAQKKFRESETWFAKAVAINPNREQALRFWGDALLGQGKNIEALSKFADAIIGEPDSRLAWSQMWNWIRANGTRKNTPLIYPPSKENQRSSLIEVDYSLLKEDDGTINWKKYSADPNTRRGKMSGDGMTFTLIHPPIEADVKALKAVVEGVKADMKAGKIKTLNDGLANLVQLDEMNLLDVYALMVMHGGNRCYEFEDFRENDRVRIKQFLIEYFAGAKL